MVQLILLGRMDALRLGLMICFGFGFGVYLPAVATTTLCAARFLFADKADRHLTTLDWNTRLNSARNE
jgi:hypothetical protein